MIVLYIIGGLIGLVVAGIIFFLLVVILFEIIVGLINAPNFMDI